MIKNIRHHLIENNVPLWAHCIMIRHLYEHRNSLDIAHSIRRYNSRHNILYYISHDNYAISALKKYTKCFKRSYKLLYYNNPYILPNRNGLYFYSLLYRNLETVCKYFKTDLFYNILSRDVKFINNFICGDRLYDLQYYIRD